MPYTALSFEGRKSLVVPTQTPGAGGTVTPDLSQGWTWPIQMPAGNITIANPVNGLPGEELTLVITQDAVGTRTVSWGSVFRKGVLSLSIGANAVDLVAYVFDGNIWRQIGSVLGLA